MFPQILHQQQHHCGGGAALRARPPAQGLHKHARHAPIVARASRPAAYGGAWQAPQVAAAALAPHMRQHGARSDGATRRTPRRCTRAAASARAALPAQQALPDGSVSVVLLAGGVGKRMGAAIPKQYLELRGQAIATYSLATFAAMREVGEIVVVCDPSWRHVFEERLAQLAAASASGSSGGGSSSKPIRWALPGAERQDSVFNGLQAVRPEAAVVAVHDSARPLVTPADAARCMADGFTVGAAVLGVPVKPTIKEVNAELAVIKTLERAKLWEVQTPQCIRPELLREGFRAVKERGLEVTDDVSIIEALGLPVRITPGSYTNIKVTTPDDMSVAEKFMDEHAAKEERAGEAEASSSSSSSSTVAAGVAA